MLHDLLQKLKPSDLNTLKLSLDNGTTQLIKINDYYIAVNDVVRDSEIERTNDWSCGKVSNDM